MTEQLTPSQERWTLALKRGDQFDILYRPTRKGAEFHDLTVPNALLEGPRGTGKSKILRFDAHMHALLCPGLSYLIVRREMPELRKSHLKFIGHEMRRLGGYFNKTESIAYYPPVDGLQSLGFFGHCETDDDVMIYLSAEYARLYIDEMTTFPGEMILKLGSVVRVPEGSGWLAAQRGGTNPLGESADFVMRWYITKKVPPEESDSYDPADYVALKMVPADNPHMDWAQYRRRLGNLPAHVRKAWLHGEWVIEGVYFSDFLPTKNAAPWHVIDELPLTRGQALLENPVEQPWIAIYRTLDFGFDPDPAICLWIAVLPSGRAIVVQERHWWRTTAAEVAKAIKRESEGMKIVESFCDPTMFDNSKATGSSVGDIFEQNGIPLTPSVNDRAAAGFAIHEWLNSTLGDGLPKLQLLRGVGETGLNGCPELIRTLPAMRQDKHDPQKIANGNDHYVLALAYFCLANAPPSLEVATRIQRPWMRAYRNLGGYRIGDKNIRDDF